MSAHSKRQANSPPEKIPVAKRPPEVIQTAERPQTMSKTKENPNGSLFRFEVIGINDKLFYGSLAECEIINIWEKVLGRSRDEIYAMSYNRSLTRNFKVTFKLNIDAIPREIYPEACFTYYRKSKPDAKEDEDDAIHCKIIGYDNVKPVELGQLTRITAKTNDFAVSSEEIVAWLSKFGSVSANHDYERNSLGLRSDVFETEIVLARHIPEYLPIAGRKIQISYPGIPKACNNCYQTGHMKRNCKSKKVDWLDRVAEIRKSGEFDDSLFGGWISILDRS